MPAGRAAEAVRRLEDELRAPVPAGVARLTAAEVDHLTSAVAAARQRQAAELMAAGERALSFVPRLLRGPLRKVLA